MEIFLAIVVILVIVYFIWRARSKDCVDGNCPCPEEVTPIAPASAKVPLKIVLPVAPKVVKKAVKKVAAKKVATKKV